MYKEVCGNFFSDVIGVQRFAMGLFTGHGTGKGPQKAWRGRKKKVFFDVFFFFFFPPFLI